MVMEHFVPCRSTCAGAAGASPPGGTAALFALTTRDRPRAADFRSATGSVGVAASGGDGLSATGVSADGAAVAGGSRSGGGGGTDGAGAAGALGAVAVARPDGALRERTARPTAMTTAKAITPAATPTPARRHDRARATAAVGSAYAGSADSPFCWPSVVFGAGAGAT